MLTDIKAIIWDFDGVLNTAASDQGFGWMEHLKERFGIDPASFKAALFNEDFQPFVEPGKVDVLDHLRAVCSGFFEPEQAEEFMAFWFEVSIELDPDMIALAQSLASQGYPAHLGTNNEPRRAAHIWQHAGMKNHMGKLFTSGKMGHRKPDIEYFRMIEDDLGLSPSALILIDDMEDNIVGARAAGWKGHHYEDIEKLKAELRL